MDMSKVKGRIFSQETSGEMDKDGFWKVVVVMTEKVTEDGENWREESISAMSLDKDFNRAHKTAMQSALLELSGLVYSRGFDSLIEGRDFEREHGKSPANPTTISQ